MRPVSPEELDAAKLPRAHMGGYRVDQTDDLLRRAAWEFRELLHLEKRLTEENEALGQKVQEFEQQLEKLQADLDVRNRREGLIGETLASTQRAAREAREVTKRECEAMIKKARKQATKLTAEGERKRGSLTAEIRELEATHSRKREELRLFLTSTLALIEPAAENGSASLDTELQHQLEALATPSGEERGQQ